MVPPAEMATDIEDDSPVLIAICCATNISVEAKTHFLCINDQKFMQPCENFVFVDNITFKHTAPDLSTSTFKPSSPTSPFKNKTATECSMLLKRLASNTGAYFLDTVFAIYDEQTVQDGSILLVQTVDDELEEMRVAPEVVCMRLLQYMIGDASIVEDREDAEGGWGDSEVEDDDGSEEDEGGVYRLHES